MSAIAGVLTGGSRDSAQRSAILAPMSAALAACGPDDVHVVDDGSAAMAFRALHVRADSRLSRQPLTTGDGLSIAWDGRLDNRQTLLPHLDVDAGASDVEVVLAAYRRWHEGFVAWLVGDFAVALRDARRQRLYLARDPFAARPLFFAARPEAVLWASTVRALAASGLVPLEVDDRWVGAYLISAPGANRTPFAAVEVVAPGELITMTPDRRRRRRFWEPDGSRSVRYQRDEDYEEAFRELFVASVRNRLRASGPVMAELSGGLDSSSIVCVADGLIAGGDVEASEIHTQSWVYDHAAAADERPFIEVVEQHTGRPTVHLLEDDFPVLTGFEQARPFVPHPWQNWSLGRRRTTEMMRERGARLMFSGYAGDHLLWSEVGAPSHLADYVVQMRPLRLLQELGEWHRQAGHPLPYLLWEGILKPLWRSTRGKSNAHELDFGFAWLTLEMRRQMASFFAESLERRSRWMLPSRLLRAETMHWAVNSRSWILDDIELGFETCYPFLDRPLVEFCLAIPFEQIARPHEMRSLHRRSLKGILPETVRVRECKRGPSDATMHAFRREWPVIRGLFEGHDARLYQRGHVDRDAFLDELRRIRHGMYGDHAIVIRALQVEVWLRFIERYSPTGSGSSALREAVAFQDQRPPLSTPCVASAPAA